MATPWYYQNSLGEEFGPVTPSNLKNLALQGIIMEDTMVKSGNSRWVKANSITGLVFSPPQLEYEEEEEDFKSRKKKRRNKKVVYGTFWDRLLAGLIDGIIVTPVVLIVYILVLYILPLTDELSLFFVKLIIIIMDVSPFFIIFLYTTLQQSSTTQATIGQKMMGLKVTDLDDGKISFAISSGRFFARILSGLIFFIGYLIQPFTEKKQALHDIMAGTLVVKG